MLFGVNANPIDNAYEERNRLVALLAAFYPAVVDKTAIEGWDPSWHNCVYIDTMEGQLSWHFHDRESELFAHIPRGKAEWDGHTTEEKYHRIERLIARHTESQIDPVDILLSK